MDLLGDIGMTDQLTAGMGALISFFRFMHITNVSLCIVALYQFVLDGDSICHFLYLEYY
jgi:hypothetical protein